VAAGRVVLSVTVPCGDGSADRVTVPLTGDEAREVVNGLGEAIRYLTEGVRASA
jgi:hypothetical protein